MFKTLWDELESMFTWIGLLCYLLSINVLFALVVNNDVSWWWYVVLVPAEVMFVNLALRGIKKR